jgi:DNA invertase Pin-like site-specific DNA recombinase
MKVALYARFSSEHQKESSITDQFRNCEQRAAREAWTVVARYADRAFSGTTADRPDYQRMLADAKAKQFDILLINDFSRLSRDMDETERARKRLIFWGVRVIGVTDGIDTSQKGHKLHSRFKGMMNEDFIDKLREDIKRGMIGQAERSYWQGGRVYGYRLVPVLDPTKTDPYGHPAKIGTRLEKDPEQATVVRQIFQMYADGLSPLKIANELNRRRVPGPRATSWRGATLHGCLRRGIGILRTPLYVGRYLWNRSRHERDPDTGHMGSQLRDESEWVKRDLPSLRIIDDTLWNRVQARRQEVSHEVVALRTLHARARSTGARPKFLLSGLLTCGECGEKFVITGTAHYGCSTHRSRGASVCANSLRVTRTLVESIVLEAIQRDLFTEEGLEVFTAEVKRLLAARPRTPDLARTRLRLQAVEQEIANIMAAIRQGILTPTTKQALEQAEAERTHLRQMVQVPYKKLDTVTTVLPDLVSQFKALVVNLATVTQFQVDKARGMLRDLVGGQIRLYPVSDGADRYLMAELAGDYAGLVRLVCGPKLNLTTVHQ